MMKLKKSTHILLVILLLISMTGCSLANSRSEDPGKPSVTPSVVPLPIVTTEPELEPIQITGIEVRTDRSYQDFFTEDPYSQLSKYIVETYTPEKELYNYLFKAVVDQEKSVDISTFEVTNPQIMDTASCLYEQAGLQLFYLNRVKWSQDYKTINFTYTENTAEEIKEYQDTFYSQMNHLHYSTLFLLI